MGLERRRYIRHTPLKQNAFAALGQNFARTGKIKDISLGGLSFEYVVIQPFDASDASRVEIFLTDMPLHVRNARCQPIYDTCIYVSQMANDVPRTVIVRRIGIKFIMLSEKHREQLTTLMNFFCSTSEQRFEKQARWP
jgi:hypothetical protein